MRDPREACSASGGRCSRCEIVPAPAGGQGESLLLAPLDPGAGVALDRALEAAAIGFETDGPLRVVEGAGPRAACLYRRMKDAFPAPLQERVKAVFVQRPREHSEFLAAMIQARTVADMFDQADVEWARQVLNEDRLFSVFQPIVRASDGCVFAHEALIRARHPETEETVGAGQLIYACQRLKLHHVLDQRCRVAALRGAAAHGITGARIFVNFLPSAIYDPDVCLRTTMETADACGISLSQLVFEVIETEHIPDLGRLSKIAEYYRRKGVGLALDDLSSGYASLQYLADLLPDYVKIDRELVESAAERDSARHTLDSIVGLAKKLSVQVIAEGIETARQMDVCIQSGVDYLQGYLFAQPAAPPHAVSTEHFNHRAEAA